MPVVLDRDAGSPRTSAYHSYKSKSHGYAHNPNHTADQIRAQRNPSFELPMMRPPSMYQHTHHNTPGMSSYHRSDRDREDLRRHGSISTQGGRLDMGRDTSSSGRDGRRRRHTLDVVTPAGQSVHVPIPIGQHLPRVESDYIEQPRALPPRVDSDSGSLIEPGSRHQPRFQLKETIIPRHVPPSPPPSPPTPRPRSPPIFRSPPAPISRSPSPLLHRSPSLSHHGLPPRTRAMSMDQHDYRTSINSMSTYGVIDFSDLPPIHEIPEPWTKKGKKIGAKNNNANMAANRKNSVAGKNADMGGKRKLSKTPRQDASVHSPVPVSRPGNERTFTQRMFGLGKNKPPPPNERTPSPEVHMMPARVVPPSIAPSVMSRQHRERSLHHHREERSRSPSPRRVMHTGTGVTPPPRYSDEMSHRDDGRSVADSRHHDRDAPHARGPVIPPGSMGASIRNRDRERDSLAQHSLLQGRSHPPSHASPLSRSHAPSTAQAPPSPAHPPVNSIDFARHPSWDVPPTALRNESYRGSGIAGIGAGSPKEGSVLMARHMSPMHTGNVPMAMGSVHGGSVPMRGSGMPMGSMHGGSTHGRGDNGSEIHHHPMHMNSARDRASGSMPGYIPAAAPPKPTSVPRVQFSDPPESHRVRLGSGATQPHPGGQGGHPGDQHPGDRRSYDSRSSWDSRDRDSRDSRDRERRGRSRRESYDSRDSRSDREGRDYQEARGGSRASVGGHSQGSVLEPPPPITGDGWGAAGGNGWGGEGWPDAGVHPPPGGSLIPPDPHPYGGGSKRGSKLSATTATGKPGSVRSAHTQRGADEGESIHQYGYAGDQREHEWDDARSHRSGRPSMMGAQTPFPPRPAELGEAGRQSSYSMAPIPVPPPASQTPSVASPGPGPPGGFGLGPPGGFEHGPPGGFDSGPPGGFDSGPPGGFGSGPPGAFGANHPGSFDPQHDYFPPVHPMDANHPLDPYDPRPPLVVHPDFADSLDGGVGTDTNRFSFGAATFNPHGKGKGKSTGSPASPGEILPPGTKSPAESKDSKFFLVHDPDSGSLAKGAMSMDQRSVLEAAPVEAAGGGGGGKGKKKLKKGGKK